MFTQRTEFSKNFPDLRRVMNDGVRFYVEEGMEVAYPSITSVLSFINKDKFTAWRKKVGEEEAERVKRHSTTRGTDLHTLLEHYLQNDDVTKLEEYKIPLVNLMFHYVKSHLDKRLDNVYNQETQMLSHKLGLAGTVDLICEVDGELSIVDFKTSVKAKPEKWLEDYFVQLSAYWAMYAEHTGIVAKKLVVILVGENGDIQIVERRNIMPYLKTLRNYVSKFVQHQNE